MAERFSCARNSWRLQEPLLGTASRVRRWVLVEQPGSWGYDALVDSALPSGVGAELRRRCQEVRARPLMIRRCGGLDEGVRRVFVASSAPEASWLERVVLDDAADVLDLDLGPLAGDEGVGGEPVESSLLLTCTNGSHDACCAEFGRTVAAALDDWMGDRAWECSHMGGDRFAANVLALPTGLYYGRVTPESAVGIARLDDAGQVSLPHYRGRSVWPIEVQAAETLLRLHLGVDGIEQVRPLRPTALDAGGVAVELEVGEERWRVELEVTAEPRPQLLTCSASEPGRPPRYQTREIRRIS